MVIRLQKEATRWVELLKTQPQDNLDPILENYNQGNEIYVKYQEILPSLQKELSELEKKFSDIQNKNNEINKNIEELKKKHDSIVHNTSSLTRSSIHESVKLYEIMKELKKLKTNLEINNVELNDINLKKSNKKKEVDTAMGEDQKKELTLACKLFQTFLNQV